MQAYVSLLTPAERAMSPQDRVIPSCFDPNLRPLWTTFLRDLKTRQTLKRLNTLVDRWGFLMTEFLCLVRDQGLYPFKHDGEEAQITQMRQYLVHQRHLLLRALHHGAWLAKVKLFPLTHSVRIVKHRNHWHLVASVRFKVPSGFDSLANMFRRKLKFVGSSYHLTRTLLPINFSLSRITGFVASFNYSIRLPDISPRAFGNDVRTEADLKEAILTSICVPVLRSNPIKAFPRYLTF